MSRPFIGFGQVPYIGQPSTRAIKLGGISSQVVPLLFQWISYGADSTKQNINVLVDLANAACRALDQIRSIYIDNLGSSNAIYVYFPDTFETLVAKPNSEGWYPVYTNARQFWVIGEGFTTGQIPQTVILVTNTPSIPSVNTEIDQARALYQASPLIIEGVENLTSPIFAAPALGDQLYASAVLNAQSGTILNSLWNSPQLSGFFVIQQLRIKLTDGFSGVALQSVGQLVLESTGSAGIMINILYTVLGSAASQNPNVTLNEEILTLTGMNLKIDATQTWRLRNAIPVGGGNIQVFSSYTHTFDLI